MCHPKVELDFLSLKIILCFMFCTALEEDVYDQLFMLEPVPSVVSYFIFVQKISQGLLVRYIESINFQYLK